MWPCMRKLEPGAAVKSSGFTGRLLWPSQNAHLSKALYKSWDYERSNNHSQNRMYWLLPLSDSIDSLIGPGELLSVVSHLFAVPILVLWVGLRKKWVNKTWMWKIFLQGHTLSTTGDTHRNDYHFSYITKPQPKKKTHWAPHFSGNREAIGTVL